jgi:hypothetical protein
MKLPNILPQSGLVQQIAAADRRGWDVILKIFYGLTKSILLIKFSANSPAEAEIDR